MRLRLVAGLLLPLFVHPIDAFAAPQTGDRATARAGAVHPHQVHYVQHRIESRQKVAKSHVEFVMNALSTPGKGRHPQFRAGLGAQPALPHAPMVRVFRRGHSAAAAVANLPLIILDPGHGGRDLGAVGVSGVFEKSVTLMTAREVQHLLLKTGRYRVEMTRKDDRFISLAARAAIAARHGAALFVSIHANASSDPRAHGASVYVRNGVEPFESVSALQARTNSAAAIGRALAGSNTTARPGSALLQYTMVDQLSDDFSMAPDPARKARLYVLSHRGTPGVLVELGFLTNRHDEALLRQSGQRAIMAHTIRDAIEDYFRDVAQLGALHT